MKGRRLWRVTVTSSLEAEDAVTNLLEQVLGVPASCFDDLETGEHSVSAFLVQSGAWSESKRKELRAGLRQIQQAGLDIGPGKVVATWLPATNWAESWKCHFRPIRIGSRLLILPSWLKRKPNAGQRVLVLDPGLSFGTGHHPTTSYCLREIVAGARGAGQARTPSLLDLGTGSGILSIAAALLGYRPVHAFENDPEALRVARSNARQNAVADLIRFSKRDVRKLSSPPARRFSVVCANLISNLLIEEASRILAQAAEGGVVVLAGILAREFGSVQLCYESAGAALVRSSGRGEWRSGTFRAP